MPHRPATDDAVYTRNYAIGILLCLIGAAVAIRLPDFDQKLFLPPLMMHRSLLTHSALVPFVLFCLCVGAARSRPEGATRLLSHPHADPRARLFTIGVCTGFASHLAFDLFPRAWWGWALVYAPFWGRLSPVLSWLWLALSMLGCLYLAGRLLRRWSDIALAAACLGAGYGLHAAWQPRSAFGALIVLATGALIALGFALRRLGKDTNPTVAAIAAWSRD